MNKEFLTTKEVAEKYNVSLTAVYQWIDKGLPHSITYIGTNKNYRFNEEEVHSWVVKQRS